MCKDGKVPVTSADIVKVASTVTPPTATIPLGSVFPNSHLPVTPNPYECRDIGPK